MAAFLKQTSAVALIVWVTVWVMWSLVIYFNPESHRYDPSKKSGMGYWNYANDGTTSPRMYKDSYKKQWKKWEEKRREKLWEKE